MLDLIQHGSTFKLRKCYKTKILIRSSLTLSINISKLWDQENPNRIPERLLSALKNCFPMNHVPLKTLHNTVVLPALNLCRIPGWRSFRALTVSMIQQKTHIHQAGCGAFVCVFPCCVSALGACMQGKQQNCKKKTQFRFKELNLCDFFPLKNILFFIFFVTLSEWSPMYKMQPTYCFVW